MVPPALGPPSPEEVCYVERLRVPLRWWALGTMFWASVLLAFLVALPLAVALLSAGVLGGLMVLFFLTYGGAEVSVLDGELRAGRARIPVRLLADPKPLGPADTKRVAGLDADARAYLLLRPYVDTSLRVRVVDPADPTPYWLVSTRHPAVLAGDLERAIREVAPRDRHNP